MTPVRAPEHQEQPAQDFAPILGWRNYWYPAGRARQFGRKPKRVKLLGEEIAIYREGPQWYALQARCGHRGGPLFRGKQQFPGSGTLTCPYHGWTWDGKTGELRACLLAGPDASVAGRARIKSYPIAERGALIWVFIGDIDNPPPVEEDVRAPILDAKNFICFFRPTVWNANWRTIMEAYPEDHHAFYLHRNAPTMWSKVMPMNIQNFVGELEDGKGLGYGIRPSGMTEAAFPGLGKYPRVKWYRFRKLHPPKLTAKSGERQFKRDRWLVQVRMPGDIQVARPNGSQYTWQLPVPMDEHRSLVWQGSFQRKRGPLGALWARLVYWLWIYWAVDVLFLNQDVHITENQTPGPECLGPSDQGLLAWRRWAAEHARGRSEPWAF